MFLNYLSEESKEDFLKLCVYAALSNEEFAEEEKEMLKEYCKEMNISDHIPSTDGSVEVVLDNINKNAGITEKKIIVLELLGLVKADGFFDNAEQEFMQKLVGKLGMNEDMMKHLNSLLDVYTVTCKELYTTIME